MSTLQAIQAISALLTLTINASETMREINRVIEQAQAEGRDITDDEWQAVVADADAADARLAQAIEDAT